MVLPPTFGVKSVSFFSPSFTYPIGSWLVLICLLVDLARASRQPTMFQDLAFSMSSASKIFTSQKASATLLFTSTITSQSPRHAHSPCSASPPSQEGPHWLLSISSPTLSGHTQPLQPWALDPQKIGRCGQKPERNCT